ncbi:MAG: ABC transporter permease [Gemmatimonadaceae bacterium]
MEAVKLALLQIRVQKLKSFFTLLGVTIGVMFLITVVSIVEGMSRYMEEDFVGKLMGINTFELRRFPNINIGHTTEATWRAWTRRPFIRDYDVHPVVDDLPAGTRWAIENMGNNVPIESGYGQQRKLNLHAIDGDYFAIKKMNLASGRTFAPQELQGGSLALIIGDEVARFFFPNVDPVGHELKVGNIRYRIIGVAEKQGSIFGFSLDKFVIVPLHSPARRLTQRPGVVRTLMIQGASIDAMNEAMEQVRSTMRARHKLRPSQPDDFDMSTSQTALQFWEKIKSTMQVAGAALPAIGLVVGAMVIMNIMLVAVAERTREIGIRKALGARRRDIMRQFLMESVTLSTIGAAIGVALGIMLAFIISHVSPLPAAVAPWSIVVGVSVGAGVGVLAGIYPASRASRLDPISAIRQE